MGDAEKASALQATFTSDSIKGLNLILNAGVSEAADFEEQLRKSGGSAKEMADIMNDNLSGDLTALNSQLEGVQIALYEKFEPALRSGVEVLGKLLNALSFIIDHSNEVVGAITAIATAIGTYLAYTTAMKVMTEGWAALTIVTKAQTAAQAALNAVMSMNPIGLVVAAIAALVAAFIYFWNTSEDFRNFWIGLWDNIVETVSGIAEKIGEFFKNLWNGIVEGATTAGEFISEIWTKIVEFFSGIWTSISDMAKKAYEKIIEVFGPAIEWFKALFKSIWDFYVSYVNLIIGLAKGCWNIIKKVYEVVSEWFRTKVIEPVANFFKTMWDKISTGAKNAWNFIVNIWKKVSAWFNDKIITPVSDFFGNMWENLKTGAKNAWEGIKSVFGVVTDWFRDKFSKAWQAVKDVFSTGGKIFDGIKDGIVSAFKTVVNAIIRGLNKVIAIPFNAINKILNGIRNVDILGFQPFAGLWDENPLSVPEIPQLAKGGILKKGQVGFLEGDGTEAVIPLEKNTQWIKRIAGELKQELGGTANNEVVNNYNFYQTNNSPKALSRLDIYRQTKNQIAMLKGV